MKILILIFMFLSVSHADYLLSSKNKCITDWYYKGGKIYYHYSTSPDTLRSSTSKKYEPLIFSGYSYNSDSKKCIKNEYYGLSYEDYNFIYALLGLLFGFMILWLVPSTNKR